jgi:hypothetical protein
MLAEKRRWRGPSARFPRSRSAGKTDGLTFCCCMSIFHIAQKRNANFLYSNGLNHTQHCHCCCPSRSRETLLQILAQSPPNEATPLSFKSPKSYSLPSVNPSFISLSAICRSLFLPVTSFSVMWGRPSPSLYALLAALRLLSAQLPCFLNLPLQYQGPCSTSLPLDIFDQLLLSLIHLHVSLLSNCTVCLF